MSCYSLLRPLLFCLDPETSHHVTLSSLRAAHALGLTSLFSPKISPNLHKVMGLELPNPVGLAAGLDKNGEYIAALASLGFGFIEIGTVTPRPQPGNPQPRLFRIPHANAIINRMGFNNDGIVRLIDNVKRSRYRGILGINIGKNFDTPMEHAVEDYLLCMHRAYPYASYITVNISSPNTQDLRDLQKPQELENLLRQLKDAQRKLARVHNKVVPLAVKIAPDLSAEEIDDIAKVLLETEVDAVIATNTTLAREGVSDFPHGHEAGGLSGAPLKYKSTNVIRELNKTLQGRIPIIGVGGIMNAADAREKIAAGASLVQIYTGLIFRGPELIKETLESFSNS